MKIGWILLVELILGLAIAVGDPAMPLVVLLAVALGLVVLWRPEWGLMWVVATLPLNTVAVPIKGMRMKLCQFLLVLVAVSWLMRALAKQWPIRFPLALVPFAAYVALAAATLPTTPSWRGPALVMQLAFFWGACFLLVNAVDGEQLTRKVWRVHLGTGIGMALLGIVQSVTSQAGLNWFDLYQAGRGQGFFAEPDWFGYYLLSVVFPLLSCLASATVTSQRLLLGGACGVILLALLLCQVRAAWLGLAVGLLVWGVWQSKSFSVAMRKLTLPALVTSLLLIVALISIPELGLQIGERIARFGDVNERANSYRLAMADATLAHIWNRPLEGYGIGSWGPLIGMTGPNAVGTWNMWMSAWFDLGLLGPLLLTGFFIGALVTVAQTLPRARPAWRPLLTGHLIGLVGLMVCNFFSDGTYFDFFWAYIGLGIALARVAGEKEETPWRSASSSSAGTPVTS